MDYSLSPCGFGVKYGRDYPNATDKEGDTAYEKYKNFYLKYHQDNPEAATDCYKEFIETLGKQDNSSAAAWSKQHGSALTWSKAFTVDFRGPDDYVKELDRRLNEMTSSASTTVYNYVTIIQSSGYGKTRSILQLTHWRPLIYICFRKDNSSGYPAATPQSKVMLDDINRADSINNAQRTAMGWLRSMIRTFRAMQLENFSARLLTDQDLATKFWSRVFEGRTIAEDSQRDIKGDVDTGSGKLPGKSERTRIIIFLDEASALLDKSLNSGTGAEERKVTFRAIRRALWELRDDVFGILTDTNSAVSNLAPRKEHDPSARDYNRKVHQPFIYIATTDCFRESNKIPQEGMTSGHDIVRFGRPLWGSYWESLEQSNETKFKDVVSLARFKLLGGRGNGWIEFIKKTTNDQEKRTASLAIVASIASLYVSPVSSEASHLVKSHMATLIAIDEERRRHLIKYPSEPVLSEAAMELLSETDAEHDILTQLDGAFQSGGIVNGGNQGELVMRLLMLSAWRRLVLSQRKEMGSEISFSVRLPVLDFLAELIEGFPKQMFSHLKDFKVGFTHFITLTYQPDEETFMNVWSRRGAIVLKVNQEGSDLVVPIVYENNTTNRTSKSKVKKLGVLVIQVKNYASQKQGAKKLLSDAGKKLCPEIMCDEDCADSIGSDYIGLFMHIGSVYTDRSPKTRTPLFNIGQYNAEMGIVISKSYFNNTKTDSASGSNNRFILLGGLNPFKLSEAERNLFQSLLRTSNDPTRICKENEQEFLFRMMPCEYDDYSKRRAGVAKKTNKKRKSKNN